MTQPDDPGRDGFQLTHKVFIGTSSPLDETSKRQMTICNLFANHELSISDIVRVLDETYGHVVTVLIRQGYIHERRKHSRKPAELMRSGRPCRMIC